MVNFYVKNEDGDYVKPTDDQIDELFKEKSAKIISKKLEGEREKYRAEIDAELRKEVTDSIKAEAIKELETKYQTRLTKAEADNKALDIKLRRKMIAAEYGFKPETEEFLGDGDDDSMRAKADKLKDSFASNQQAAKKLEKQSTDSNSGSIVTIND